MRCRLFFSLVAALTLAGCSSSTPQSSKSDYQTVAKDPHRDSDSADQHNTAAVKLIEQSDYARAETALKAALAADVMHGPAHNNLGKVYFHDKKFYLAAWEFQYAAKLMPNVPEPRNNLGLVFESAGKLDDAVSSYDEARNLEPDNVQILGNLARARVRRGDHDESTRELLRQLVLRETRPDWANWARERLELMNRSVPSEPQAN
jgi:Flp pilus assembly protein TadD